VFLRVTRFERHEHSREHARENIDLLGPLRLREGKPIAHEKRRDLSKKPKAVGKRSARSLPAERQSAQFRPLPSYGRFAGLPAAAVRRRGACGRDLQNLFAGR